MNSDFKSFQSYSNQPNLGHSVLSNLSLPFNTTIKLRLKRDDLIHEVISGNKWRKLKYNLLAAKQQGQRVITFGGAYSNHLVATAYACKLENIESIGIVRGEELTPDSNETLSFCRQLGMHLVFYSRAQFDDLQTDRSNLQALVHHFPNSFIVPMGGANHLGVEGCRELGKELSATDADNIAVCAGTASMAAGVLLGLNARQRLLIFPAVNDADDIRGRLKSHLYRALFDDELVDDLMKRVDIITEYAGQGFAKVNSEVFAFYEQFQAMHGIELDLVYTSKMLYGLMQMIQKNEFPVNANIIAVHSGGIQGNPSIINRFKRNT